MRAVSRALAALAATALVAVACGGGEGSDAARRRLGGSAEAEGVPAGGSPSAGETVERPLSASDGAAISEAATSGTPQETANGPASGRPGPSSLSSPGPGRTPATGPAATRRPAADPAGAGSAPGAGNPAPPPAGRQPDATARSGTASPAPGVPDPGDRTGVAGHEILFGMHLPQSGPVGFVVGDGWQGAAAYFRSVNDAGGVHGRRIRMVVTDDGYSAQKAAGAIRELVDRHRVFAASCFAGVDQCVVGLEYAEGKGVPYLHGGMAEGAVAGKAWAYPVTASYPHGAGRLADYLFAERGYTPERRIAALHVNSPHYEEMASAMEERLRRHGSRFAVRQVAEKDQSDFSAAVIKMKNAGVDTLWAFIDPALFTKFVAQARALRFEPRYIFSPPTGGDLYATAVGPQIDGAFALASFADPHWPGAAEFRRTFAAAYPDDEPNEGHVLTYVVARVFAEGLRRAGPDLGRDAFARAMAGIDHFDTGVSSPLSYTRRHRLAAANSTLAVWEIHGTRTDQVTGFDF